MSEPLVWLDHQNYYNFRDPATGFVYDFQITEAMPLASWIRQLDRKQWVTAAHKLAFFSLVGREYDGR